MSTQVPEFTVSEERKMSEAINAHCTIVAQRNERWWRNPSTGQKKERNVGEMLMLCVSELSEAMEGDRKNLQDDKLPQYKMYDVECIDCLIRLFDMLGHRRVNAGEIFVDKMIFNAHRKDHTNEARLAEGGKKY